MADTGIRHQALQIGLHHRHPRSVDDPHEGESRDPGEEGGCGLGEHGQGKAKKAVGPHFQEHPGQEDASRRGGFHMGIREPGMKRKEGDLNGKGQGKSDEKPRLDRRRDLSIHQHREVKRRIPSRPDMDQGHCDNGHEHQERAGHCEEDKLDGGIDSPGPTPDPDDEVHGKQRGLPKDIEEDQV